MSTPLRPQAPVAHGGDPSDAPGGAGGIWLDLSTGINPHAYPATVSDASLRPLPQRAALTRLEAAARAAYRVPEGTALVAAPGTQALLQVLPHLVPAERVAVLGPTYQEHEHCWRRTSAVTVHRRFDPQAAPLWVVVNPNNPDGRRYDRATLARWAGALAQTSGRALADAGHPVLVIDEAFMDLTPDETAAGIAHALILKSFGKFYGLAGLRLGFALGEAETVARLGEALGPWAVSGPALEVGAAALADAGWAEAMRARLAAERAALEAVLSAAGLTVVGGTDLFLLVEHPSAKPLHGRLAAAGVWTRRFEGFPERLRFGLPGAALDRFAATLSAAMEGL